MTENVNDFSFSSISMMIIKGADYLPSENVIKSSNQSTIEKKKNCDARIRLISFRRYFEQFAQHFEFVRAVNVKREICSLLRMLSIIIFYGKLINYVGTTNSVRRMLPARMKLNKIQKWHSNRNTLYRNIIASNHVDFCFEILTFDAWAMIFRIFCDVDGHLLLLQGICTQSAHLFLMRPSTKIHKRELSVTTACAMCMRIGCTKYIADDHRKILLVLVIFGVPFLNMYA